MRPPDHTSQEQDARRNTGTARQIYPVLGGAVVFVLAVATVVYHYLEYWSWVDAFYFSAVAGSTVGFGDLAPTTNGSKLFTVVHIFSSIGTAIDKTHSKLESQIRRVHEKSISERDHNRR
jgi:hypothetical protein